MSLSNPVNPPLVNEHVAQPVSTGVVFGVDENQSKINQLHGIAPNNASGAGIPKQVTNVQVSVANATQGTTCIVSILYSADPSDKALSGVNIYVKGYQGNSNPVRVGSGTSSPTTIVLNNTGETLTFIVQAFGNGGGAPFNQAPTCSGTLPKSTLGGFGATATTSPNNLSILNSMKGSIPPSLSTIALNGMTWTTTSTSVTFSWGFLAIWRADGTQVGPIPAGSQAVTGLVASQSYTAYPYWDEPTQAIKWVGPEVVFPTITSVGFNGTTQYLTTTTSVLSLPTSFTLEAWVNSTSATQRCIMSLFSPQTGTGAPTHQDMELLLTAAGEVTFQYVNATAVQTVTTSGAGINDGAWHHIVVTFATGGTIVIYVDTVSKGTASALGAPRNAGIAIWYHIGYAGANSGGWATSSNGFFNGSLAHVALYPSALSTTQISNHFVTGINVGFAANAYPSVITADSPTYYWQLNETSGTSAADSAGSGNTGTYQGSPTLNQQAPVVVPSGSPAIMWPYKNFLCTQAQSLQSRIPLSAGSLNPSTPASGSGGGGGGGTGGGGQGGCFSGNTRVKTNRGIIPIEKVQAGDSVLTARGTLRKVVRVMKHEVTEADTYLPIEPGYTPLVQRRAANGAWLVIDMGEGEMVTLNHSLLAENEWKRAYELFADSKVISYPLPVFNLSVEHNPNEDPLASDAECSFVLANGWVAHNFQPK